MKIDCTNLPCPEPVIKTKKALESIDEGVIDVIVNSDISKQNVIKFASSQGFSVSEEKDGKKTILSISKGFTCEIKQEFGKVLFLKDDKIGKGKLGKQLMIGLLSSILEQEKLPKTIICVNKAVFLSTKNKDAIKILKTLSEKGVQIHSCGACLEHFNLKLKVGEVANAYFVAQNLMQSEGVISL